MILSDLFPWDIVAFIVFDVLVSLAIFESHLVIELRWRRIFPHDYVLCVVVYRLLRVRHVKLSRTHSLVGRVAQILTRCKYLVVSPIDHKFLVSVKAFLVIIFHLILLIEEH